MPAPALALLLLAANARVPAPHAPSPRELGPFLLGQYESNVIAKLGKPTSEETGKDGERTLLYSLAGDMDTFLAVTLTGTKSPKIVALQLTGDPKKGIAGLGDVNLGDTRAKVVGVFGEPDRASEIESGEFLQYDDRTYSFVFQEGRLGSIKISLWESGFPKKEATRPDLAGFQRALASRDRDAILGYLCADFEIYTRDDDLVGFEGAAREELRDEESLVARYLVGGRGSVRELLTPTLAKTPAIERDGWPSGAHPVNAISSQGPLYEIVWNFEAGRWRVWEISLVPNEDERRFR